MVPVRVFDGLISETLHTELIRFFQEPIWMYGWKSNGKKQQAPNGHWNVFFAGQFSRNANTPLDQQNCESELMAEDFLAPVQALWRHLSADLLKGHEPVRVYANAHTYGTDGYVHTDSDDDNYFSTICYLHPEWNADWAGELVFFNEARDDVTQAVFPRPGRIVHFAGNQPHCARPLSRDCGALRVCLVFKTRRAV